MIGLRTVEAVPCSKPHTAAADLAAALGADAAVAHTSARRLLAQAFGLLREAESSAAQCSPEWAVRSAANVRTSLHAMLATGGAAKVRLPGGDVISRQLTPVCARFQTPWDRRALHMMPD